MQKIIEIQSIIKEENKISYLMGDFNIDLLKVNTHAKTNEFVNDVISQGFLPKITRPTRITPHSATLIDHIYSNDNRPTFQNNISGIIITDVADHFGTFHRGDRGWLTSFAPKVRFSKNCIIFANCHSVHTF